jgi:hypothetical protein
VVKNFTYAKPTRAGADESEYTKKKEGMLNEQMGRTARIGRSKLPTETGRDRAAREERDSATPFDRLRAGVTPAENRVQRSR